MQSSKQQAAGSSFRAATPPHGLLRGASMTAEGVLRGHRSGLLTVADYNNLCQCENLEDIKLNLVRQAWARSPRSSRRGAWACVRARARGGGTRVLLRATCVQTSSDYGAYLANEASPLHTTTIVERCTQKLVDDWNKMRCQVRDGAPRTTRGESPSAARCAPTAGA